MLEMITNDEIAELSRMFKARYIVHDRAREAEIEARRQMDTARLALAEAVIRASGLAHGVIVRTPKDGEVRVWDASYTPGNPRPTIRANFKRKDKAQSWSEVLRTYSDYTLPPVSKAIDQAAAA